MTFAATFFYALTQTVLIVLVMARMDGVARLRLLSNLPDGCSVDDVNRAAGDVHTCPECGAECYEGLCRECRSEFNAE